MTWLDDDERSDFEFRINRLASACGCGEGATASVVALVLYAAALLLTLLPVGWGVLRVIAVGVGAFVSAGLAGKALGLLVARRRLDRELARLRVRGLPDYVG